MITGRATLVAVFVVLYAVLLSPAASAQQPDPLVGPQGQLERPRPRTEMRRPTMDPHTLIDLRRRLIELDKLLSLKSLSRAESLMEDLAQHSQLQRELEPRRIRLAQLKGEHEEVLRLVDRGLAEQPTNPALWRARTGALLATGRVDSVRHSVDRFLATSPNLGSALVVSVEQLTEANWHGAAVSLIDSMRVVLGDPRYLARARALELLRIDRQEEASSEIAQELRSNPYNLPLLRRSLLDGIFDPRRHRRFGEDLIDRADSRDATASLRLLAANILLVEGRAEPALKLTDSLLRSRGNVQLLLQNAATLDGELELLEDDAQLEATVDFLLQALSMVMSSDQAGHDQKRRAADSLAHVCVTALDRGALGKDPQASVDRFGDLLASVRRINPQSESLYTSQIRLAVYTRDVLGEPMPAARRLEHMLLDLDLPTPGVALVRLTLGECYLAAGDTARGRVVLTRLGRDPDFRAAGGHAHYHLARLDLAEGHFATARDRFAVVAIDHPTAPYANEALEMGLAIAEEMENPSGGPNILSLYAPSVYYDLVGNPEARMKALETFLAQATPLLDSEEPQHLLERGQYELAELYAERGRNEDSLRMLRRIVAEHPHGRYAADALVRRAKLLAAAGETDSAREELDLLLAQYPDYLYLDDVRDLRRELP